MAAVVAAAVTAVVLLLPGAKASWPTSVSTVQAEAARACQNPNVMSEPGQVNFACAKATRQILWVFALLTSADNPNFDDARTGRIGLEPITPAQGGEVAWSLNLHHPYNPANPIDSLAVAARAINNIIGGATFTAASGKQVVQPGLESHPANCARYTGSAAAELPAGFPKPVRQARDQRGRTGGSRGRGLPKWIVGARPVAAHDAAILFENANNPGSPRAQAILRRLPNSKRAGVIQEKTSAHLPRYSGLSASRRGEHMYFGSQPRWQHATALVSLSAGGAIAASPSSREQQPTWHHRRPCRFTCWRCKHAARAARPRPAAALGHRQRGPLLPPHGQEPDSGGDLGHNLAERQHRRRRSRPVRRGLRQPDPRAGGAGRWPAKLGDRRQRPTRGRCTSGPSARRPESGLPRRYLHPPGRRGPWPLASAERWIPAAARRLGAVR